MISGGSAHNLAVRSNGTVIGWGYNVDGECDVPAGLSDVTAVAAGNSHSLALRKNGTVIGWGYNGEGECDVPAGLSDVTAVAAGNSHSLALRRNGTVVAWGSNYEGQRDVPAGLSEVTAIAAGYEHSLALRRNGTVVAWGSNGVHQCDVPADLSKVTAIAAGDWHSLALETPPPSVASISPATGKRGMTVRIKNLAGSEFFPGDTVKLTKGAKVIAMKQVNVTSPEKITGKIKIPATAKTGKWNVVVTNFYGQSGVKAGAFTVKA